MSIGRPFYAQARVSSRDKRMTLNCLMPDAVKGRHLTALLSSAATLALSVLLFPALTVFYANVYDYSVGAGELLGPALTLALALAGVLALAGLLLPRRWRPCLVSVLVMLAVAAWLQTHILVWDYGVLDGGRIPWGDYTLQGILELAVWLGLLAVAVSFAGFIAGQALTLCVALVALQSAGLYFSVQQAPAPPNHHFYTASEQGRFEFSADRNVVVLILDAFQADLFQEIISNEPAYRQRLQGFHFYRNALAGYAKTYPSIPLMLTGQWYRNEQPITGFMRDAWLDDSVPVLLREQDWDVRLYPYVERVVYYDEAVADNFQRARSPAERMEAFGGFIDAGVFRSLPHFLKPYWLNDYDWRARRWLSPLVPDEPDRREDNGGAVPVRSEHPHEAVRWLEDLQARASTDSERPAFRFYHLFLPHAPFLLNEELEMENMPINREGYYRHSLAAVNLVLAFLDELRALGIHDDTFVAVLSEHGGGEYRTGIDSALLPASAGEPRGGDVPGPHHESGLPLVLIKPFGADGELQVNDLPVSIGDVAATLAGAAGLAHDFEGRDMVAALRDGAAADRERRYLFYRFDGWVDAYLPDMVEYRVRGHSWLPRSWQATGEVFSGQAVAEDHAGGATALRPGGVLRFGEGGSGHAHTGRGWSGPESGGTWTSGRQARLTLPLASPLDRNLHISMELRPFLVENAVTAQRVVVSVNGVETGEWRVSSAGRYGITVPAAEHRGTEALEIRLDLPDATRPAEHLVSTDARRLGLFVRRLDLQSVSGYTIGEPLDFRSGGNADEYVRSGWSPPEAGHRWSEGPRALMHLVLDEPPSRDLLLRVRARPFLGEGAGDGELTHQTVTVRANGRRIATWEVGAVGWYEASIPADLVSGPALELAFEISDPLSPLELGLSMDGRALGLMVEEMRLDYQD